MKRLTRAFLVLALLLLSAAATSFAAPAVLEVTVSATSPRIGDRVLVRVAARGGEDLMWGELKVGIEAEGPWVVVDESHHHAGHPGARSGGGHFRIVVVSDRFEGKRLVERQRLVYAALSEEMGPDIHALSMKTLTPDEWQG